MAAWGGKPRFVTSLRTLIFGNPNLSISIDWGLAMATVESEIGSESMSAERSSLLRAARSLAERHGLKNLTLNKVAAEARLPRKVVVGYFASTKELLLCAAVDSVVTLARVIARTAEHAKAASEKNRRDGAVILTLPRRDATSDGADPAVTSAREVSVGVKTSSKAAKKALARAKRRPRRAAASRRTKRRAASVHDKSAGAPAATYPTSGPILDDMSRALEDRRKKDQRSIERAIPAKKKLQKQSERNNLRASSAETVRALQGKLSELVVRIEQCETQHVSATTDLRLSLNEAQLRIQTVESVARAALLENQSSSLEKPPVIDVPPVEPHQANCEDAKTVPELSAPRKEMDYLKSARASANAAAAAKVETKKTLGFAQKIQSEAIAVAAFLFVSAAVGVALGRGLWNQSAPQELVPPAPPALVVAAADAPLDRLTQGALAGDANAELAVALKYLDGVQGPADPGAALHWLDRSATHGNAVAQYVLGSFYENGRATTRDLLKAMRWYEASALQGNRKAMHSLAIGYAKGFGGSKSPTEAVRWFSRAASFGYVDAQFNLAVLYERGLGVPQSLLDAYKWYMIAARQGDAEAKARTEALQTQLLPDDLAAARHAADAFRALPLDPATNTPPNF